MKTTLWKTLMLLTLVCTLLFSATALGQARYPTPGDVVTDDANVLSQTMARDIADYAGKLEQQTGLQVHVALVLFLDGETAQTYADTLFARWALGKDDLLLLGAAAEDTFAMASGEDVKAKLSDASLTSLMYASGFSDAFRAQRYDAAMGSLFVKFNELVSKQYGETVELDGLFADYRNAAQTDAAPATTFADAAASVQSAVQNAVGTVVETTGGLWDSTMNAIANNVQSYKNYSQQNDQAGGGMSAGGWIVLIIIVLIVLGQGNRARRRGYGGCGCSPVGWIFSGLGLGALLDRFVHRDWWEDRQWQQNGDWRQDREWRQERREHRERHGREDFDRHNGDDGDCCGRRW